MGVVDWINLVAYITAIVIMIGFLIACCRIHKMVQ